MTKVYDIKLAVEGFKKPTMPRDIDVPETFFDVLDSLGLIYVKGSAEFEETQNYTEFKQKINATIETAKIKISEAIKRKLNISIRPQRIKIKVICVDEITRNSEFIDAPF